MLLFIGAPFAAIAARTEEAGGSGPSGPPTSPSLYTAPGSKIGVQWTNGDATASTEVRYTDTSGGCPSLPIEDNTSLRGTAGAGSTSFDTEDPASGEQCSYFIAHKKDGIYSDWVQVTKKIDESNCLACPT